MNTSLMMGKYGWYVWSAYGVFATVFIINGVAVLWNNRCIRNKLGKIIKRQSA